MAVTSNRDYIVSTANGISGSISSSSVMGGVQKNTFGDSTASCPSLEPNLVETFLGTCKEVFRRISEDTANVSKIGDGFVSMDNAMAKTATTLNMEVKSYGYDVGTTALTANSESESLTNANVRKKIEEILAAKGADFKLEDRSGNNGGTEESPGYWGGYSGSSGSSGTPTPTPSELPTVAVTEVVTEVVTEEVTETIVETEAQTEAITDAPTEIQTEIKTEVQTVAPTVPVEVPTEKPKPADKPYTPSKEPSGDKSTKVETEIPTLPVEVPTIIEDEYIDTHDVEIEEPIDEIVEEELPEPIIEGDDYVEDNVISDVIEIGDTPVTKKKSSGIGTAAAIIGAGAAIGGVAYGANKFLKNKEEKEDEELDWGDEE